jgi:sortase A
MPRRRIEQGLWTIGILLVGVWALHRGVALVRGRAEVTRFNQLRAAGSNPDPVSRSLAVGPPDLRLWSPQRITLWRAAQADAHAAPLGVLRIARLALEVPILEGTTDEILDRGAGHIEETPAPGTTGNSGIAGHRDGFFRALKDIAVGDAIDIDTLDHHIAYRVEKLWTVTPDDVWVLDPTDAPSITLVTCFPFYFIGPAPQRFIVRAVAVPDRTQ